MATAAQPSAEPIVIEREWLDLDAAKAYLGKSEKSLERLARAGHLRSRMESREGRRAERLWHAGDLQRIKSEAIPASALPGGPARGAEMATVTSQPPAILRMAPNGSSSSLDLVVAAKPMTIASELSISESTLTRIEALFERVLTRDQSLDGHVPISSKTWLTWAEARDLSGIPALALRQLVASRAITAQRFGRSWRVLRESLEGYRGC